MPKMTVDPNQKYPRPYWPQELKDEGFVGELMILGDAFTATALHPKASLKQVRQSLEVVLKDIDLRIAKERGATREAKEANGK